MVAVFQPHRYSRTAELWAEFGQAFGDADVVVVTDVYGAGEAPVPGVTGRLVADAVRREHPGHAGALRGRTVRPARRGAAACSRPGDLCCTLGAGDLTSLPDELMSDAELVRRPVRPAPTTSAALDAGPRGPAPGGDHPLGALTTYRVGGTAALFVEVADEARLRGGGPPHSPGPTFRCWCSGGDRTCWWPTGASTAWW